MEDGYLVEGVLGGYVTSGQAQGRKAAELLIEFLSGTPVSQITPVKESPNEYVFNDRALEALGLALPKNIASQSKIINQRLSFYDEYQGLFIGFALTVVAALVTVLALYSIDVTSRNRKLHRQSKMMSDQQKKLEMCENRFHLLLERSQNPMLIIRDGKLLLANRAAVLTFGYDRPSELEGIDINNLLPEPGPDDKAPNKEFFDMYNLAWEKGFYRFSHSWKTREGNEVKASLSMTRVPYDDQDAIICICLGSNDIANT